MEKEIIQLTKKRYVQVVWKPETPHIKRYDFYIGEECLKTSCNVYALLKFIETNYTIGKQKKQKIIDMEKVGVEARKD